MVMDSIKTFDITTYQCPMTFVKAKLLLEEMHVGDVATLLVAHGEPADSLPDSLRTLGHEVLDVSGADAHVALTFKKRGC